MRSAPTAALTKSRTGFEEANTSASFQGLTAAAAAPPPASITFCMKPRLVVTGLKWLTDSRICSRRPLSAGIGSVICDSLQARPENRAASCCAGDEPGVSLHSIRRRGTGWIILGGAYDETRRRRHSLGQDVPALIVVRRSRARAGQAPR